MKHGRRGTHGGGLRRLWPLFVCFVVSSAVSAEEVPGIAGGGAGQVHHAGGWTGGRRAPRAVVDHRNTVPAGHRLAKRRDVTWPWAETGMSTCPFTLRRAERGDSAGVVNLIRALAGFEKLARTWDWFGVAAPVRRRQETVGVVPLPADAPGDGVLSSRGVMNVKPSQPKRVATTLVHSPGVGCDHARQMQRIVAEFFRSPMVKS